MTQAVGALQVDETPIGEPADDPIEGRQLLARETIVVVEGVQEVEGRFHADVVGVALLEAVAGRSSWHRVTTLVLLTGYAQEATVRVTDKELLRGYRGQRMEVRKMEPIIMFVGLITAFVLFDLAAVTWGVDSRDSLPDDHRR